MIVPVLSVAEVLESIRRSKSHAKEFCTNFFPDYTQIETWIGRGEFFRFPVKNGSTFLLHKDRDFYRLYLCTAGLIELKEAAAELTYSMLLPVVADVVSKEGASDDLVKTLCASGFQRSAHLQRLARGVLEEAESSRDHRLAIEEAGTQDAEPALRLIEENFDPYTEQVPVLYEMESAIAQGRVLLARQSGQIAGLLFFEQQGISSAIRFWVVASGSRGSGVGNALMRAYWEKQRIVRRFTLWVNSLNTSAIQIYRRYGYTPDGLTDQILTKGAF